jgi:hypothetical protein
MPVNTAATAPTSRFSLSNRWSLVCVRVPMTNPGCLIQRELLNKPECALYQT